MVKNRDMYKSDASLRPSLPFSIICFQFSSLGYYRKTIRFPSMITFGLDHGLGKAYT
jgi:hypothetical protein